MNDLCGGMVVEQLLPHWYNASLFLGVRLWNLNIGGFEMHWLESHVKECCGLWRSWAEKTKWSGNIRVFSWRLIGQGRDVDFETYVPQSLRLCFGTWELKSCSKLSSPSSFVIKTVGPPPPPQKGHDLCETLTYSPSTSICPQNASCIMPFNKVGRFQAISCGGWRLRPSSPLLEVQRP